MTISSPYKLPLYAEILLHIGGWIMLSHLLFNIPGLWDSLLSLFEDYDYFDEAFIYIPLLMALYYTNTMLIQRYLNRRQWPMYLLLILILYVAFILSNLGCILLIKNVTTLNFRDLDLLDSFDLTILHGLVVGGISSSATITRVAIRNAQQQKEAEYQQRVAELKFLKTQVNPHFLFNTLNTIYYLSSEEEAPKTEEAVLKLSEMMRYMLNETKEALVPLQKELNYLEAYVDLQRLRLEDSIPIDFEVTGNLEEKLVAPLLFIPFVENAFKYGISYQERSDISIKLKASDLAIRFEVSNYLHRQNAIAPSSNVGLVNVRKRLELMYKGRYKLQINQTEEQFIVLLELAVPKVNNLA